MTIYHIVLVKFTKEATSMQKKAWKDGVTSLKLSIPQVKEILSGTKLPHVKDGEWDDGVIMRFNDESDLRAYVDAQPHRIYQAATAEQTADKLIFDLNVE